jgi:hypothetical protein
MRQGQAQQGEPPDTGTDAGDDFPGNALCGQEFKLFPTPAKDARVTTLEPDYRRVVCCGLGQQPVNGGLALRDVVTTTCADWHPDALCGTVVKDVFVDERIMEDDLGPRQHPGRPYSEKIRRSWSGPHEIHPGTAHPASPCFLVAAHC